MKLQQPLNPDRLQELLAARAIAPLTDTEAVELGVLLSVYGATDIDTYDALAALLDLAIFDDEPAPLPGRVRQQVERDLIDMRAKGPSGRARRSE